LTRSAPCFAFASSGGSGLTSGVLTNWGTRGYRPMMRSGKRRKPWRPRNRTARQKPIFAMVLAPPAGRPGASKDPISAEPGPKPRLKPGPKPRFNRGPTKPRLKPPWKPPAPTGHLPSLSGASPRAPESHTGSCCGSIAGGSWSNAIDQCEESRSPCVASLGIIAETFFRPRLATRRGRGQF
jgi:hypothetical protein